MVWLSDGPLGHPVRGSQDLCPPTPSDWLLWSPLCTLPPWPQAASVWDRTACSPSAFLSRLETMRGRKGLNQQNQNKGSLCPSDTVNAGQRHENYTHGLNIKLGCIQSLLRAIRSLNLADQHRPDREPMGGLPQRLLRTTSPRL